MQIRGYKQERMLSAASEEAAIDLYLSGKPSAKNEPVKKKTVSRDVMDSTTNTLIDDTRIVGNRGEVTVNMIAGAHIFKDIFAGFRDLFGGKAQGYSNILDDMKQQCIENLKVRAAERGCNAVIGVEGEMSGGGKSMLMVTVTGTTVITK
ncbi:YbjQ family protein [Photobacterium rosenbergii]|uniref:YbjQ family protein n=1 Tax=Photobacterium rosenbergii TaxID=294936 RepID=UPI001C99AE18|nr:heavy metal-binding domain-containing protein [Photobacterium rosenbergii]MBY5948446.1 YbjQ family protein [Photobacterium rosenbergii]